MPRKIFTLRLSEEERLELEEKANASGLNLSDYVRGIILNGKVTSKRKSHQPKINQQVYLKLSSIAQSLEELTQVFNDEVEQNLSSVEQILLTETIPYIKELRRQVIEDDWKHH